MVRPTAWVAAALMLAAAAAGCGTGRKPAGAGGGSGASANAQCVRCHGGQDNDTGAPPVSVTGQRDTTFAGVGAHTTHVTDGPLANAYDCAQCHPDPRSGSTQHLDGKVELAFGPLATAGGRLAPALDATTNRCSNVYCHGATLAGGANVTPTWTNVGQDEAGCGTCHGVPPPPPHPLVPEGAAGCQLCHAPAIDATGTVLTARAGGTHLDGKPDYGHPPRWMDPADPAFHGRRADRGLGDCQLCHGQRLDGGLSGVACAKCHVAGGTANDFATCTACHGGVDNRTGAPPRAILGYEADAVRVGAHTAHVTGSAIAPPFDCALCHVKPTDLLSAGHIDPVAPGAVPLATVNFFGIASQGTTPAWARASATCSATYCHGAFTGGNGGNAPVWTGGPAQAACGTCHGIPPPPPHPNVRNASASDLHACNGCHALTIDASGQMIPPPTGKHLDGQVETTSPHAASWMDPASSNFHAFTADRDIVSCTSCHGASLEGDGGPACASCHVAGGQAAAADFTASTPSGTGCTGCHGGVDSVTGAPPRAIWGKDADPSRGGGSAAERATRVGAHTTHLAGGPLAPAFGCPVCHVQPAAILSPGHIDFSDPATNAPVIATVPFGGIAAGASPGWDRSSNTCSGVYCHGATLTGGSNTRPNWTVLDGTQDACGTCHSVPPPAPHVRNTSCGKCHAGYTQTSVATATHVNGTLDVVPLTCTTCHGSAANAAPPEGTGGETSTTQLPVGAHQAHLTGTALGPSIACTECHVVPTSTSHANGVVDLTWGPLATTGGAAPRFDFASGACSGTYCHGAFRGGNAANAPLWTGGPGQASCGTCHATPPGAPHPAIASDLTLCSGCHAQTIDATGALIPAAAGGKHLDGVVEATGHGADWMNAASPSFHAFSAEKGLTDCKGCHGASLQGTGSVPACASCHRAGGTANDFATCAACHGGKDNQTGAPPVAIWGYAGDPSRGGGTADLVRVGAHSVHLAGSAIAPGFDCGVCHVKPATLLDAGHIDDIAASAVPYATLTFGGLATTQAASPSWTRSSATCASTYCHGAFHGGNTGNAPVWTGGPTQATCGTCHAIPPPSPHPAITGGLPACNGCHAATIDAAGNLIPPASGGKHLDGIVEATGHDASWMDRASPNFHAYSADKGLSDCKGCHGASLQGSASAPACASCHTAGGSANDFATCTACHGGQVNQTGAPPEAIWGYAGDANRGGGTLDPLRVGAHTVHLTGSAIAPAFDCGVCHVRPASMLDAGHIDEIAATAVPYATLTFGGTATAQSAAPTWTRSSATCAGTYCHGAFRGGSAFAPVWTGDSTQAACGTCHATPPPAPHPAVTGGLAACNKCHAATVDATGVIIPPSSGGKHLDGVVEATGHDATWMDTASPNFHAFSAEKGLSDCQGCHGQALDGGTVGVACAQCHVKGGTASDFATCTACHGGKDNQTGAPPVAIWGYAGDANRGGGTADPVRVGAHTVHLAGSAIAPAFDCGVCHVKPATLLDARHIDVIATTAVPYATLTFGGVATAQAAVPAWTRSSATCAGTYCHGAFRGGNTGNAPVWTGGSSQAACGTCHATPPPAPHPAVTGGLPACSTCHAATIDATGTLIPPASGGKHLDGVVEATGHDASWMDTASPNFHAFSAEKGLSQCQGCHGQALDGGIAGVACAQCHKQAGTARDFATCTACHGGVDNQTGAPPAPIWGYAGDPGRGGGTLDPVRVGAHTAHLAGSAIAPPFDCAVCHVKPSSLLAAGHIDDLASTAVPYATLTFGGLATAQAANATWTRSSATCAATYCHGGFSGGNAGNLPVWTGGGSQATCGTCHGIPPPSPHPAVASTTTTCHTCHADTIDATGAMIPPASGGKHLDGLVEATGHDASWMDTTSPGFHAFSANLGLSACQACHGADLGGGSVGVACAGCHKAGGAANDFATCTACHGGTSDQTGAPPKATWGHAGDPNRGGGTLDPIRVGAHTTHVSSGTIAAPFACGECHVKPATLVDPAHVDQATATVTFGALAAQSTAPVWTRSSATCASTWCHGGYSGSYTYTPWDFALDQPGAPVTVNYAGKNATPVWTSTGMTCGSCHDNPPRTGTWHSGSHGGGNECELCHPDASGTAAGVGTTITNLAQHVNGTVDVSPRWGTTCFGCH